MKGYKIDLTPYVFELKIISNSEDEEADMKTITVEPKYYFSPLFGNPNLGASEKASKAFDLYELGGILNKIQLTTGNYIILDKGEFDQLKKRAVEISKSLGMKYYEMIRRVREPEEVELSEKKPEGAKK